VARGALYQADGHRDAGWQHLWYPGGAGTSVRWPSLRKDSEPRLRVGHS
jgi:hypothetical protein